MGRKSDYVLQYSKFFDIFAWFVGQGDFILKQSDLHLSTVSFLEYMMKTPKTQKIIHKRTHVIDVCVSHFSRLRVSIQPYAKIKSFESDCLRLLMCRINQRLLDFSKHDHQIG